MPSVPSGAESRAREGVLYIQSRPCGADSGRENSSGPVNVQHILYEFVERTAFFTRSS